LCGESDLIWVPGKDGLDQAWVTSDECVWRAPYKTVTKTDLAYVTEYATGILPLFFRNILAVKDFTYQDSLEELKSLKSSTGPINFDRLIVIYNHLMATVNGITEAVSTLRYAFAYHYNQIPVTDYYSTTFESAQLIYCTASHSWHAPSSCVWIESTSMPDKAAIASPLYKTLVRLFTEQLGVTTPDLAMLAKGLCNLSGGSPEFAAVKKSILEINLMNPTPGSLRELDGCNIMPVRTATGYSALLGVAADYAIVDREKYVAPFRGKATLLDFGVQQVRELQPFLTALGLENRHMTLAVRELSRVSEGKLDVDLTNEFRQRAWALTR
jgi:hypothetical protein